MNLLARFKAAYRSFANPSEAVLEAFAGPGGGKSRAGVHVTPSTSLTVPSVFACVRNLSEDCAKLPLIPYREQGADGKVRMTDSPLYRLLHDEPNPEMSSMVFRQGVTACALLGGNGYAEIERNGAGKPIALWPLVWPRVQAKRAVNDGGKLYYLVDNKNKVPAADMLHVPGFTTGGVLGEMITALGRESIGLAMAGERFAASFFGNGAMPGGLLKHKGELGEEGQKNIRKSWNQIHQGPDGAHNIAILEEEMDYVKIGADPDEAQMVQSRQFQVEEVARWFRMPPHKIGHLLRATGWSTLEATNADYVIDTLMPWLVKWEQEINRKLLSPRTDRGVYVEHLVDSLLRGDTLARYQAYQIAVNCRIMCPDEIRARENLNPIPDGSGKLFLVPLNMGKAGGGDPADAPPDPAAPSTAVPLNTPDTPPDPPLDRPDARAAIAAAHRAMLVETFGRFARIEADKRARAKADAAFWGEQHGRVREQIAPAVRALTVSLLGRDPAEDELAAEVAAVTELHIARSRRGDNTPEAMADATAARIVAYAERSDQ